MTVWRSDDETTDHPDLAAATPFLDAIVKDGRSRMVAARRAVRVVVRIEVKAAAKSLASHRDHAEDQCFGLHLSDFHWAVLELPPHQQRTAAVFARVKA